MALTVGTLVAELEADTGDFEKVLKGASSQADRLADDVSSAGKQIQASFDKAEGDARRFGSAMDRAADATDASESKFMGTADLLDGLGGAFGLPTEGATNMMRSFGDLSGGFAQVGPLIGKFGSALAGLALNPVVLGIAALAAGIVILWKNSETFREIVIGAFEKVKSFIGPIIETIGGWLSKLGGLFGGGGDDAEEMTESMKMALEQSQRDWDDWKNGVAQSLDSIVNPLNRARDQSKVSMDEIKANLTDNVAFYEGWINNLNSLTSRGFGQLASYLYSLGPTAEKAVGEAYKMTDPQLAALERNITGKLGRAGDVAGALLYDGIGNRPYDQLGMTIGNRVKGGLEKVFLPGSLGEALIRGGGLLGTPLQKFHDGGVVPGPRGAEVPIMAQGGEMVLQPSQLAALVGAGGGGNNYTVSVQVAPGGDLASAGRQMIDAITAYERNSGTAWRRNN